MKITEEKLQEWKLLLDERKHRGLKIEEFCKEKNITASQFYYFQKRVKQFETKKDPVIDKTVMQPIKIMTSQTKENTVIRFILPNSLQCVLPRDMTISEIKSILELVIAC